MDDRRRVLEKNVTPIKNRIMFSEQTHVTKPEQLQELMGTAIKQGLEGLVLKDLKVGQPFCSNHSNHYVSRI